MAKYRVEFSGSVEVEAESELEAEVSAAFDCSPDNCRAELVDKPTDASWEDFDK